MGRRGCRSRRRSRWCSMAVGRRPPSCGRSHRAVRVRLDRRDAARAARRRQRARRRRSFLVDRRVGRRARSDRDRRCDAHADRAPGRHLVDGHVLRGRPRAPTSALGSRRTGASTTRGRSARSRSRRTSSARSSSVGRFGVDHGAEPRTPASRPVAGDLSGVVAALAADDVWAVGGSGQGAPARTLIEHWDGTAWSVVRARTRGPFPNAFRRRGGHAERRLGGRHVVHEGVRRSDADPCIGTARPGTGEEPERGAGIHGERLVSVSAVAADDVWAVGCRATR